MLLGVVQCALYVLGVVSLIGLGELCMIGCGATHRAWRVLYDWMWCEFGILGCGGCGGLGGLGGFCVFECGAMSEVKFD